MRAVIYARVSSQRQKDQHTIASQLETLPAYVKARGWKLARPASSYVDDGRTAKSGHLDKRDGMTALLRDAAAGLFDVVVVVSEDRLTRSEDLIERYLILGTFQRHNVHVAVSGSGQLYDMNTANGELLMGLQASAAASWLKFHRERIKRGKDLAIAKGKKPAGPTPFGYTYDRWTGVWGVHPVNGPIVVEIFRRIAAGHSAETIGRELYERGVERPRSGRWSRNRVLYIAKSRTYTGEWVADKARGLRIAVPVLVDEEMWQAAEDALLSYGRRGVRKTQHVYLCQGRAVCGKCGSRMRIHSGYVGNGRPAYYVCARRRALQRKTPGSEFCDMPMRQTAEVDGAVWDAVRGLLEDERAVERLLAHRRGRAGSDGQAWAKDLADYEARLRRLDAADAAILDRFRRGLIAERVMDVSLSKAQAERRMLERQVLAARRGAAQAGRAHAAAEQVQALVDAMRARLPKAPPEVRRAMVEALVPGDEPYQVTMHADRIEIRGWLDLGAAVGSAAASGSCSGRWANGIGFKLLAVPTPSRRPA